MRSIRVHLAAIMAFHSPIEGYSIFTHPTTARFLRGLGNLYPLVWHPTLVWVFSLVRKYLTRPQSEPMSICSLLHLSVKTAFLIAITLVQQVGEIEALMAYYPFTVFFKYKVTLRPHPKFLPKVSLEFHFKQPIHLPLFHPKLPLDNQEALQHTLDIWRALASYLDRTKFFGKTHTLFVSLADKHKVQFKQYVSWTEAHSWDYPWIRKQLSQTPCVQIYRSEALLGNTKEIIWENKRASVLTVKSTIVVYNSNET